MNQKEEALAYAMNFTVTAFVILSACLKNQGSLGATQFEDAIRSTIGAEGAASERLDYVFLEKLLNSLERNSGENPSSIVLLN